MRVLVVEDDLQIAGFLKKGLQEAGYAVDCAADGEFGYRLAINESYDAAIVDLMLPRKDGLSLIEDVRMRGVSVPVLILSARRSVDDRIRGLQRGGDDYLVKPFVMAELIARVHALIRRSSKVVEPSELRVGPLTANLLSREVVRSGTSIELRAREFALLEYLMRNAGHVVTKSMIIQHIWDFDFDPQTNVVEVLVHRLRAKIDQDFSPKLLLTMRGVGYVLRHA